MRNWPEEDLVNGFLLPFRLLIHKRHPGSWRAIGKLIRKLDNSISIKKDFIQQQKYLNEYLDSVPEKIKLPDNAVTRRDILLTFLNGYYAHMGSKESERLEVWRKNQVIFDLYELIFMGIVITLADNSYCVSESLVKPLITQLRSIKCTNIQNLTK